MPRALTAILLALVAIVPYLPTLGYDFVYDDVPFIARNDRLETATVRDDLLDRTTMAGGESFPGTYRPLRTFAFALDTRVAGKTPWLFHAANVFLHGVATALLYLLLSGMLAEAGAAFYATLLFAIHPAAIEAVAWCSSRDNGLLLVFFLGALLLHRRAREGAAFGAGAVLCFALALLAKEMAATFPALALVHDRTVPGSAPRGRRRATLYAGYVATLLGYLALRAHVLGDEAMQRHVPWGGSWATSVMSGIAATGMQLVRAIVPLLPRPFTFDAQAPLVTSPLDPSFLLAVVLLGTTIALGAWGWKRRAGAAFFVLWFPITILPVANVLYPINILSADRFLYLPAIGPLVVVGLAFDLFVLGLRSRGARWARVALPIVFAVGFALVLPAWRDSETLWSRVLASSPSNPRALVGLADARAGAGDLARARDLLESARQVEPAYGPAWEGGIAVAARRGDLGEAARLASGWVESATRLRPAEAASVAEKCVPVLRSLAKEGRAADALALGRLLERAGATSRDFACLYAIVLEASDLADEAKRWRARCDAP
jgi:protein O-mannosyl-transferase